MGSDAGGAGAVIWSILLIGHYGSWETRTSQFHDWQSIVQLL
jgi:hypothetical protein